MTWLNAPQGDQSSSPINAPEAAGEVRAPSTPSKTATPAWALVVAVVWAVAATIIGLVFIVGVEAQAYGGDAYTGIESAIVTAVHAIGFVIISSGILGVIIAGSRSRE